MTTVYTNLLEIPTLGTRRGPKARPENRIALHRLIVERARVKGFCTLSNSELADTLGLNKSTCSKLLSRAWRSGYIRLEYFHGDTVDEHGRVIPQQRRAWPLKTVECVEALEKQLSRGTGEHTKGGIRP